MRIVYGYNWNWGKKTGEPGEKTLGRIRERTNNKLNRPLMAPGRNWTRVL